MDKKKAIEQCDNDEEFMLEMLDLFREDLQDCINLLNEAFQKSDYTQLKELSHRIKGQAATLAANDILEISTSVELASGANNVLEKDFLKFLNTIQVFLNKTSN